MLLFLFIVLPNDIFINLLDPETGGNPLTSAFVFADRSPAIGKSPVGMDCDGLHLLGGTQAVNNGGSNLYASQWAAKDVHIPGSAVNAYNLLRRYTRMCGARWCMNVVGSSLARTPMQLSIIQLNQVINSLFASSGDDFALANYPPHQRISTPGVV